MSVSWTEIQSYLKCPRNHELAYLENLQRKSGTVHKARYWGTVFHVGLAEALRTFQKLYRTGVVNEDTMIKAAIQAARNELKSITVMNKTVMNPATKQRVSDEAYYLMVNDIEAAMPALFRFFIPLIGLGTKYLVYLYDADTPMVEWEFDHKGIKGIVDAVLIDMETDEAILVDWKLRSSFPFVELAAMDGQLALYAAVLRDMGVYVTQTIMWQVKRSLPKPARLNQNGTPSIAAQDTTWDVWFSTLPPDLQRKLDVAEWQEKLSGKIKTMDSFVSAVGSTVNDTACRIALDNAHSAMQLIEQSRDNHANNRAIPAVLGTFGCAYCDFYLLCSSVLKYGGDATELIEMEYEPRKTEIAEIED